MMLDTLWIKIPYLLLMLVLVMMHMEYVHRRPVAYSRRFILAQLTLDLAGFTSTWVMLTHLRPTERWIPWFLGVHGVVHLASLAWAAFHWPSLERHMVDFQARRLHPVFQSLEFLYEQSDCALYLTTAALVAVTLPVFAIVLGIICCSAIIAAWRPTAGFASPPARLTSAE